MLNFYVWTFFDKNFYLEKFRKKQNAIWLNPKNLWTWIFSRVLEIVSKILFEISIPIDVIHENIKNLLKWKLNRHRMQKKKHGNWRIFTCAEFTIAMIQFFSHFSRNRITIKILNQEYKVFYIGTNTGRIYKIVQFMQNGESKSTLLDIFEVAQNEPIQVMQISQKRKSLYVSTDHRIKQIDLAMCSRRYDSCFRCVKDPYCGWDQDTNLCKPFELGLLQVSFYGMPLNYNGNAQLSTFYGISVSFYYSSTSL